MDIFENLRFKYEFRKHQNMMLQKFEQNNRQNKKKIFKFHLVSPPGSGKTIVGLEMVKRLKKPTLVICPNTTIQGQWVEKYSMFLPEGSSYELQREITTHTDNLKSVNVFTYQMLSVPCGDDDAFIRLSENLWAETVSNSQGVSIEEALLRICRMRETNPKVYRKELSKFNKKLRQSFLNEADISLSQILHPNTLILVNRIKKQNIKTVVFDECHHLQSYWALVMKEIIREIDAENIIGLTATPPVDEDKEKLECYTALLGEIDFQIPTPSVIKEGMLAPYQDLVYFCSPTKSELDYIKNCHEKFKQLTDFFNTPNSDFSYWISDRIMNRKLLSGKEQEWKSFFHSRPHFAIAGIKYLIKNNNKIPWDITIVETMYLPMTLEDWLCLLEDYALNLLKLSSDDKDKSLLIDIKNALRSLGYLLTEKGIRSHSSPLDRVLAYSKSKLGAVKEILKLEMEELGDQIRAAIITDFEISNALSIKKSGSVMDEECGGAVSVMKELVSDAATDKLDPVMVTGKSLICDDDLAEEYIRSGLEWAKEQSFEIRLSIEPVEFGKFVSILGSGKDWNSRTAVLLTTYLFEKGVIKCIIGTRGLLSEGWDSINLNTLIDLSAVTTFAAVNQLRGRSIRKSEDEPRKVSNNWDVICIAPGMEKGYNDLGRLYRKHEKFYGLCDDGEIQMGINHIDPALSLNDFELTIDNMQSINTKMLAVARDREKAYEAWKIGMPFDNKDLGCCEIKLAKPIKMKDGSVFTGERRILRSKINRSLISIAGTILSTVAVGASVVMTPVALPALGIPAFLGFKAYKGAKDIWIYGKDNFFQLAIRTSIHDIAKCTLMALVECELIDGKLNEENIVITERSGGIIRVYLNADDKDSELFSTAVSQIFSPIEDQRYAIQRFKVAVPEGSFDKFIYLFRYGTNKYQPLLSCYHPLADVFGTKQKALVFRKYWNKFVSPGDIVFLKGLNGREIVEKYGRTNPLGARKINMKIWK